MNMKRWSSQRIATLVSLIFFRLFLASAPDSDRSDLLSELEVMKTLKPHRHVIRLLGCVTETGKTYDYNDERF